MHLRAPTSDLSTAINLIKEICIHPKYLGDAENYEEYGGSKDFGAHASRIFCLLGHILMIFEFQNEMRSGVRYARQNAF